MYPQLTDEMIKEIINNDEEMEARVYIFPTSSLKINDKKINKIIDETPFISNIRKEFYKKILKLRYEIILKINYEELLGTK